MAGPELEAARLFLTDDELAELIEWVLGHVGGKEGPVKRVNGDVIYLTVFRSRPGKEPGLYEAYLVLSCPMCNWSTESAVCADVSGYLAYARKAILAHHREAHLELSLAHVRAYRRLGGEIACKTLRRSWYDP